MKPKTWLIIIGGVIGAILAWRWYAARRPSVNVGLFSQSQASEADKEWLTTYSYRDRRTGEIVYINPTLQ